MKDLDNFDEAVEGTDRLAALQQLQAQIVEDFWPFAEADAVSRNAVKRSRRDGAFRRRRHALPDLVHGFAICWR